VTSLPAFALFATLAAQPAGAPSSSSSSALPEGCGHARGVPADATVRERRELPRVSVALSIPLSHVGPAHALLAARVSESRATEQPLAALRAAGGDIDALLRPDGLLVVVEADARELEAALAAARFLTSDVPFDEAGASAALARALMQRAFHAQDDELARVRAAAFAWYGARSPWQPLVFSDIDLLQVTPEALEAARAQVRAAEAALFVEGRVRPVADGGPSSCDRGPPAPSPALARRPSAWRPLPISEPRALSHPLPTGAADDELAEAVAAFVEQAGAQAGVERAFVARAAGVRLLVVELRAGADPDAVRAALSAARSALVRPSDVRTALQRGAARAARARAPYGALARRLAEERLVAQLHDEGAAEAELLALLRVALLPERMRISGPQPPG
jgi:hypothetical protein